MSVSLPDQRGVAAVVPQLLAWFRANARDLPWRRTRDPYAIWVSEIMLQQTQVGTVVPYYQRWMRALPNVRALARASSERLHKLWEGLGYYRRVRHLQDAARQICTQHGGRFPESFADVLGLPGVGRYTAGAICSIAFNQPTAIVDGNVVRVLTRLFAIVGDPAEAAVKAQLWQLAEALVKIAAPACSHLNQSLMELGATVCTPRVPRCEACPVARLCVARRHGMAETLPRVRTRPLAVERHTHTFVLEHRGRFLAGRNGREQVNGQLWEFPGVEVHSASSSPRASSRKALGSNSIAWQPAGEVRHSITRYRIRMRVFRGQVHDSIEPRLAGGRWLSRAELRRLPFAAAHRRVADAVLAEQGTKRPLARVRLRA